MIWQATEWQGSSGNWYCNCLDNLAGGYGAWFMPARILDITPAEFLTLLIIFALSFIFIEQTWIDFIIF